MPTIEITEDQREYLDGLRDELERDVVGPYGHVRLTEAIQYLIDSREGEVGDGAAGVGSDDGASDAEADTDDGASDGDESDAETERDADAEDADGADAEDVDDDDEEDADAEDADDADAEDAEETEGETDDEREDGDAEGADDAAAAAPTPGGGGDRLSAMMQLLDTHEEKWREGSGDARYEVELPDGSTETAQTKDDVRALLFKNY